MQLPQENSSPRTRVRYGRYVQAKLRRAKLTDLEAGVRGATDVVKAVSRDKEDAEEAETLLRADRDAIDDVTEEHVQNARNQLAGRSIGAAREEPMTLIFPDGIDYYLAAPLDEWDKRMGIFAARVEKHLPENDALRATVLPLIAADRQEFAAAVRLLAEQSTATTLAGDKLSSATDSWERQLEKTFGALVEKYGKRRAERFFPRSRRDVPDDGGGGGGGGGSPT